MADTNVDAIRAAVRALNAGDFDRYFESFTEDCKRIIPGSSTALSLAEVRASLEFIAGALDGFRLDEVLLFGEGRHVCAHWRIVGKHTGDQLGFPPIGRAVAVDTAEIYEFDAEAGGRVHASWSFGDPAAFARELGIPETSPGGETR
jgi:predicted ester cyclase